MRPTACPGHAFVIALCHQPMPAAGDIQCSLNQKFLSYFRTLAIIPDMNGHVSQGTQFTFACTMLLALHVGPC